VYGAAPRGGRSRLGAARRRLNPCHGPRHRLTAGFPGLPAYAELHCRTNFSFQVGASHAEELVARAHALGYTALAITDECSVAGLVRAHAEAKKLGLKLLAGSEPLVAVVAATSHMHVRSRKALHDVITAVRLGTPVAECGFASCSPTPSAPAPRLRLAQTFTRPSCWPKRWWWPSAAASASTSCATSTPMESVPRQTPASYLRRITYEGAGRRYPEGVPARCSKQIEHELR
jgi:DNA polymerase III alpha subunit